MYRLFIYFVFGSYQEGRAVLLAQLRLFDLACRVPGNFCEDDLAGPLVAGKLLAVVVDVLLGACEAFLELDNGCGDPRPDACREVR